MGHTAYRDQFDDMAGATLSTALPLSGKMFNQVMRASFKGYQLRGGP